MANDIEGDGFNIYREGDTVVIQGVGISAVQLQDVNGRRVDVIGDEADLWQLNGADLRNGQVGQVPTAAGGGAYQMAGPGLYPEETGSVGVLHDGAAGRTQQIPLVKVGELASPEFDQPEGVYVDGNYAYIADAQADFVMVVDVSDPTNPVEVTRFSSSDLERIFGVVTGKGHAFVGGGAFQTDLVVLDITDPTSPSQVAAVEVGDFGSAFPLFYRDETLYTCGGADLVIWDVSDPANPSQQANITVGTTASDVFVRGDTAFVSGNSGLTTVDVSDATNPEELARLGLDNTSRGSLRVQGSHAYVLTFNTVNAIDISDPSKPTLSDSLSTTETEIEEQIYLRGDFAYLTADDVLVMIDISDPSNLRQVGFVSTAGGGDGLAVHRGYAYVTHATAELLEVFGGGLAAKRFRRLDVATGDVTISTEAAIQPADTSADGAGAAISATLASGLLARGAWAIVTDEGGNAGTNSITIDASGASIDGNSAAFISADHGDVRVYSDASNWFTY